MLLEGNLSVGGGLPCARSDRYKEIILCFLLWKSNVAMQSLLMEELVFRCHLLERVLTPALLGSVKQVSEPPFLKEENKDKGHDSCISMD